MLHRNSSAGTAAQKSSKCSLIQRPAVVLAMLLLCAVFSSEAQTTTSSKDSMFLSAESFSIGSISYGTPNEYKYDTIAVVLLVSDTLQYTNYTPHLTNYYDKSGTINWVTAYAVRKITIEKKGSHQSGDMMWFNDSDKYYYNTEKYLDGFMQQLSKHVIVWQVVSK